MSLVDWTTAFALLIVVIGGAYGAALAAIHRRVEIPPYIVEGRGAFALALLYAGGALAALVALVLLFAPR